MKPRRSSHGIGLSGIASLVIYAIVLSGLIAARIQPIIPIQYLFRDIFLLTSAPPHWGFISNLGILLWCATATTAFYNAILLRILGNSPRFSLFFLCSSFLVLYLTLDDFFMLHEAVIPKYLQLSEEIIFVAYIITGSLYLFEFRKEIFRTRLWLLVVAVAFLGLSMAGDKLFDFVPVAFADSVLIEDGSKFLGIVSLFLYFFQSGLETAHNACLSQRSMAYSSKEKEVLYNPLDSEL